MSVVDTVGRLSLLLLLSSSFLLVILDERLVLEVVVAAGMSKLEGISCMAADAAAALEALVRAEAVLSALRREPRTPREVLLGVQRTSTLDRPVSRDDFIISPLEVGRRRRRRLPVL